MKLRGYNITFTGELAEVVWDTLQLEISVLIGDILGIFL